MKKLISIYTPCYNEEKNIHYCYQEIKKIFSNDLKDYKYEHIFGDNGSEDNTLNILKDIARKDKNIKVVSYSRNFGAFNSIYHGTKICSGDAILPMLAADLQDPPKMIVKMINKWEEGFDIVYGRKIKRDENFIIEKLRNFYYKLSRKTSNIEIHENVGEFCIISKNVQAALKEYNDYFPYLRGMIASCGFKYTFIDYEWGKRKYGKSSANFAILLNDAINGIISYSIFPIRLCVIIGFIISSLSLIYAFISLVLSIVFYQEFAQPGINLLITAIFFFFGFILFFVGIIGEYVGAIHQQVRTKPLVIEKERINF